MSPMAATLKAKRRHHVDFVNHDGIMSLMDFSEQ
jgi:hypothetical protein